MFFPHHNQEVQVDVPGDSASRIYFTVYQHIVINLLLIIIRWSSELHISFKDACHKNQSF
jgi:hypothetical protein